MKQSTIPDYRLFQRKLIACLLTANVVWYLVGVRAMEVMEQEMYDLLLATRFHDLPDASDNLEIFLIFVFCLIPTLFLLDRPRNLVLCSIGFALLYGVVFLGGLWANAVILPIAGPMLGLGSSTAVLGTMAWSRERSRRNSLEDIEKAKQQFTDMLVHDLRNRMSSVAMSLSLLEKEQGDASRERALRNSMGHSIERMLLQTNTLLDIRRIKEGKMRIHSQALDPTALVQNAIEEHTSAAEYLGVRIHYTPCAQPGVRIHADKDILRRALANLIWNALKHAPRGSTIELGPTVDEQNCSIFVQNAGPVIGEREMKTLFEAFESHPAPNQTTEVSSTGLGLTFCKLAAEAHQGRIELASPAPLENDGVRATLVLPLA